MKDFVVLMDTVGDLSPELLEREEVETIPLTLRFDNEELVAEYGIAALHPKGTAVTGGYIVFEKAV